MISRTPCAYVLRVRRRASPLLALRAAVLAGALAAVGAPAAAGAGAAVGAGLAAGDGPPTARATDAADAAEAADDIVLSNAALELRLDPVTGAVRQLEDVAHGLRLVAQDAAPAPPFRVGLPDGVRLAAGDVAAALDPAFDGTAVDLAWPLAEPGLEVRARIELAPGDAPARFTARVAATGGGPRVDWLEYPVIAGVGPLGPDPARTDAILPYATGYRVADPSARLAPGARLGFYPDGYGGAPLQQLSYLERGVGGFHAQVEDGTGGAKQLDLWRDPATGRLEFTVRRYNPDARAGAPLDPPGAVAIAASGTGAWEEGADRYRAWAEAQPWAAAGPRRAWPDGRRSRWLFEQTGVATFGISVRRDQRAWFRGLKDLLGVPLFHVSGFWWPGGTLASEWYGGYDDWSDDRVDPANLAAIRGKGDRVALFLFPQHFARGANEYLHPAPDPARDPVAPWAPFAMAPDPESGDWSYMCPATTAWQDFYGWRAVTLMTRHRAHAEYLDIGPGLGRVHCEDAAHGHPPAWGGPLVDGLGALLDARRDELHALRGAYVPRGTELIAEPYLGRFDFYQARAAAGPLAMLEGDRFRAGVKAGWAEKVPLFDYVYHDLGPVRLDGNLKLAPQLGGLFAWVAAKVVLEGGLPELNYELSALERLAGMTGPTWFETYRPDFDCEDRTPYGTDAAHVAFLQELADLRTRRGLPFLAYGRMRRGPQFAAAVPRVTLDWRLYNTYGRAFTCAGGVEAGPEYADTGAIEVDAVVGSGWSAPSAPAPGTRPRRPPEDVALALAEVGGAPRTLPLVLDPARQGVPLLNFRATLRRRAADEDLGVLQAGAVRDVALAAREALLAVLAPAPCAGPACRYRVYRAAVPGGVVDDAAERAVATGRAWSDVDAAQDGATWFYLVDDGGGYPGDTLAVTRSAASIDLAW